MSKIQEWTTPEALILIKSWARKGLTYEQIAQNMGVSYSTFDSWKKKNPEFSEALKQGRGVAVAIVEDALFKRATGFEYTEQVVDPKGGVQTVTRYSQPDVNAIKYYLNNRARDEWKDKPVETEQTDDKLIAVLEGIKDAAKQQTSAIRDASPSPMEH